MKKVNGPTAPFDMTVPSYSEITKIVHKIKGSASACPLDQISVLVLKNCPYVRTILHRIICHCWNEKTLPKIWKYGFTVLIHKKDSTSNPANFRPITLEPVFSKILSSLIRNRILNTYWTRRWRISRFIQTSKVISDRGQRPSWILS